MTSSITKKLPEKNISTKITQITENILALKYKLEGEEEVLIDIIKGEKYKLTSKESLDKMIKLLFKYVKAKLRMCYNMNKIKTSLNKSLLVTNDFEQNSKLLVLIPDRGLNSLGVFSTVSLIYDSVKKGSMINYVESGITFKYSVMILNPNKGVDDHYSNCEHIWKDKITSQNKINCIVIIAHQNAGVTVLKLMSRFKEDFRNKVRKIVMINSSNFLMYETLSADMKLEFENKCTNYILSNTPVGTLLYSHSESMEGCENRSCGVTSATQAHHSVLQEIKKFFI